ncbi:MAG: DUF1538 domain-containing protein [Methanophagales archaeon ANME-1-THS]|nr:MAG: DUF1538 domain-containing protein [Methanophagales archaeon ANME-1-THS]
MIEQTLEVLLEVVGAITPVLALILFFQIVVLRKIPPEIKNMLFGVLMAVFGFFLFLLGAKMSLLPMGERIGTVLSEWDMPWVVLFTLVFGITGIFAEPAVKILAYEIEEASSGSIRKSFIIPTIALGVGFALVFGTLRIFRELSLAWVLIPGYLLILLLTRISPKEFVPMAYDAGAVATGPIATTFALPMMTGMAIGLRGGGAGILGLGTVGLIAMCPIIFMLSLGIILNQRKRKKRNA